MCRLNGFDFIQRNTQLQINEKTMYLSVRSIWYKKVWHNFTANVIKLDFLFENGKEAIYCMTLARKQSSFCIKVVQ